MVLIKLVLRVRFLFNKIENSEHNCHTVYFETNLKKANVPRGTFQNYLPINTRSTLISEGETPLILEACAMVTGRIALNFSLAS